MRSFAIIILSLLASCSSPDPTNESTESNDSATLVEERLFNEDSVHYWVSADYLENLADTLSICDCWRKTQFHLLEIDTVEMNLHIQSNLFHFGMDSQADFPLLRNGNSFESDTSQENFINELISFEYPISNSFELMIGSKAHTFHQKAYPKIKDAVDRYGGYGISWDLWDQSAILNSTALLNYDEIDSINSTQHYFSVDSLQSMIHKGEVRSGCSDDFSYNHMGYENAAGELEHFHLQFFKAEVRLYKVPGRDRHVEVELDPDEMQIFVNSSY